MGLASPPCRQRVALLGAHEARPDLGLGIVDPGPGRTLHRLSGLEVLVDAEEVLDLQQQVVPDIADVADVVAPVVRRGTQSTLSSPPTSSRIRNIAMARHRIRQPGKVGSETRTSTSSGSPS